MNYLLSLFKALFAFYKFNDLYFFLMINVDFIGGL